MFFLGGVMSSSVEARTDAPVLRSPVGNRTRTFVRPARETSLPELACLRGWLSEQTIAAACERAVRVGVGADRVLVDAGTVDDEIYLRMLADSLGIAFDPLDEIARMACPLNDARLIEAPASGLLPLMSAGNLNVVVAPRGDTARRIVHLLRVRPELARTFRLTTAARLQAFVMRHAAHAVGDRATNDLARRWREMSAAPPRWRPRFLSLLAICAAVAAAIIFVPLTAKLVGEVLLSFVFLSWMVLRLVGLLVGHARLPRRKRLPERDLPIYTILAPLYRETTSLGGLIASLRRLDYPGIMAQTPQAFGRVPS